MTSADESTTHGIAGEGGSEKNAAPGDPPRHLNDDAQSKWRETWPRLDHNRFDAGHDRGSLAEYCEAWADIRQADSEIKGLAQIPKMNLKSGTTGRDASSLGPLYEQRAVAMDRFDRAAEKLGLSLDDEAPSGPWTDYLETLILFQRDLAEQDQIETNSPARGQQRIWTYGRVWSALRRSFGNVTAAAGLLSENYGITCARSTIVHLLKRYARLRAAVEECEEALFDFCKSALIKSAFAGDADSAQFLLRKFDPRFSGRE